MKAYTYILECADGTYYTGWTNDLRQREKDHNTPGKGAKYTRSRIPCRIVYYEEFEEKSDAMRREWEIKHKYTREKKAELIQNFSGTLY